MSLVIDREKGFYNSRLVPTQIKEVSHINIMSWQTAEKKYSFKRDNQACSKMVALLYAETV